MSDWTDICSGRSSCIHIPPESLSRWWDKNGILAVVPDNQMHCQCNQYTLIKNCWAEVFNHIQLGHSEEEAAMIVLSI